MIARGFKSVIWVATVGGAALCCYMVSLRVATERADLAKVEVQIVAAKRDIRSLQTELGTRGRLTQLEQWNSDVLALAAPTSAQFVNNQVTLARLERHDRTVEEQSANIRMASAEVPTSAPASPATKAEPPPTLIRAIAPAPAPSPMVHRASYTPGPVAAEVKAKAPPAASAAAERPVPATPPAAAPKKAKPSATAAAPAKPAIVKPALPRTATAAAKPVTLPSKLAASKPAPAKPAPVKSASAKPAPAKPAPAKPATVKTASAKPAAATAAHGLKAPGGEGHR